MAQFRVRQRGMRYAGFMSHYWHAGHGPREKKRKEIYVRSVIHVVKIFLYMCAIGLTSKKIQHVLSARDKNKCAGGFPLHFSNSIVCPSFQRVHFKASMQFNNPSIVSLTALNEPSIAGDNPHPPENGNLYKQSPAFRQTPQPTRPSNVWADILGLVGVLTCQYRSPDLTTESHVLSFDQSQPVTRDCC